MIGDALEAVEVVTFDYPCELQLDSILLIYHLISSISYYRCIAVIKFFI